MKKKEIARELRKQMTETEGKAWEYLRDRRFGGFKFRRQHVLLGYIVDFYSAECGLVLEVDGGVHSEKEQKMYDQHRDEVLRETGLRVVRVANEEVGDSFFCSLLRELQSQKDEAKRKRRCEADGRS